MPGSQRAFCSSVVRSRKYGSRCRCAGGSRGRSRRPGPRDLLGDHDVEPEVVDAPAAVLLGDGHPEEPVGARGGEHLARHDARRAPTRRGAARPLSRRTARKLSRNASCSSSNRWRRMGDPSRRRWRAVAYQRAGARSPASLDSPPCGARSSRRHPYRSCAQCRTPLLTSPSPCRDCTCTTPSPARSWATWGASNGYRRPSRTTASTAGTSDVGE